MSKFLVLRTATREMGSCSIHETLDEALRTAKDLAPSFPGKPILVFAAIRAVEATVSTEVKEL